MMSLTGKEKFYSVLDREGGNEFPVTLIYDQIFHRDHIFARCRTPWWYTYSGSIDQRMERGSEIIASVDEDWMFVRDHTMTFDTDTVSTEVREGKVFELNKTDGSETELLMPPPGGLRKKDRYAEEKIESIEDIDRLLDAEVCLSRQIAAHGGKERETARALCEKHSEKMPYAIVFAPAARWFLTAGMTRGMLLLAKKPEVFRRFCERYLEIALMEIGEAAACGAECVQIDLGYMDMTRPEVFKETALPGILAMTERIREKGMISLLNFLGDCRKVLDITLSAGADVYHFEDRTGNRGNDILELAEYIGGKAVLQGNLSTVEVLGNGSDRELEAEVKRQAEAGRRNRGRFIMCTGGPVAPETGMERVEEYLRLCRRYGKMDRTGGAGK
ncbi:MAG: uroporphyrinogen decarboxylase family protein [Emergencia sp.]